MCGLFLEEIDASIRWKWAIIALHQALYGFAICAIRGTNSTSVLRNPDRPATSQVIDVWTALDRAKSRDHIWPGATPLRISTDEDRAIRRLISEFRNGFEHFGAVSWSIEVSGMPLILRLVVRVTRFLALESGALRYESEEQHDEARAAFDRLDRALTS